MSLVNLTPLFSCQIQQLQDKGLWFLTPISTIFQLYRGRRGQFYWWRKPEYPEKPLTYRNNYKIKIVNLVHALLLN